MKQKIVLVTGASGGIGHATAKRFLEAGYAVACGYHAHPARARALERLYPDAHAVRLNIDSRRSVKGALAVIARRFGRNPDVIVNNAAIIDEKPFDKISDRAWDRMLRINLRGAFIVSQEALPAMRQRRFGRVINIASIGGQWGGMRQVHYAAAKAGLVSLTHSISKLYAGEGITSNAISPGLVATTMVANELRSQIGKRKLASIPVGRMSTPEEIAAAIFFLASDEAATITGQTLNVNGGMLFS